MIAAASNIIQKILNIDKTLFTKNEIIDIIKNTTKINRLPILESHGITLNTEKFHITFEGVNHVVPRKVFELLYYLMENKNRVMRRSTIMHNVWGDDIIVGERTVDVHVRKLRAKFPSFPIQTVKGIGYMFKE